MRMAYSRSGDGGGAVISIGDGERGRRGRVSSAISGESTTRRVILCLSLQREREISPNILEVRPRIRPKMPSS